MNSGDLFLRRLLHKKKELIKAFSDHSRRLVLSTREVDFEKLLSERENLINDLKKTDQSIFLREQEISASCLSLEKELCEEITGILKTILNNDQKSLAVLEEEKKKITLEKKTLNRESNLKGYLR